MFTLRRLQSACSRRFIRRRCCEIVIRRITSGCITILWTILRWPTQLRQANDSYNSLNAFCDTHDLHYSRYLASTQPARLADAAR